jgi:hypothetical protein
LCLAVLFSTEGQRNMAEHGSTQQHSTRSNLKKGSRLGYIRRLGWAPLGAQPNLSKPNLEGAHPDTWLSLLEKRGWRCGTHVHATPVLNMYPK